MQRIIHEYKNKSYLFNQIENLYAYVSDADFEFDDVLWLDNSFKTLCDILQAHLQLFRTPKFKDFTNLPTIGIKNSDTKTPEIVVCISGGKDSAATAFYYKQKGYKVHLYHAHGLNKYAPDEEKAVKKIAEYLGCDVFIETIQTVGSHNFTEHPLKNYIIANGAIHFALGRGYSPTIAFGNFNKSSVDTNEFEVCGGDCIEMWQAYTEIIHRVLPEFIIEIPLETNADTFNLLAKDWQLFSMSVSCMSPLRFREHWKHRTEQKYNIKLFENRCGCCWKCCIEAIWLMDTEKMDFNEAYYIHCMEVLGSTVYKESGFNRRQSIQEIWENYMFYPFEQSKCFNRFKKLKFKVNTSRGDVVIQPKAKKKQYYVKKKDRKDGIV